MRRWAVALSMLAAAAACSGGDDGDDNNNSGRPDAMPAVTCGDSMCMSPENCSTCPQDCGACPPSCGDGSCNGTETCSSCPGDCGECSCSPGDCVGEEICINESCVSAFGRTYTISIYEMTVKTTTPDGETWDAVGGAPDPYVVVALNDTTILVTAEKQDTFAPTFTDSVDVVIPAGATLAFAAWDGDVSDDDLILNCWLDPLTADYLRAYGPRCSGSSANGTDGTVVDLLIAPK